MFDEVKITNNKKKTTMLGNFSYYNPTKLYFGDESLNFLKDELKGYGPVVLLNYGSGSVKHNGIYDQVVAILKEAGKTIVENPGVMTNPTLEKQGRLDPCPWRRQRLRLLKGRGCICLL